SHDLDFVRGDAEFQQALRVAPHEGRVFGDYACSLSALGKFNEAEKVLKQGEQTGSRDHNLMGGWCWRYYFDRHFKETVHAAMRLRSVYSNSAFGLYILGRAQERLGQYEEALATSQREMQVDSSPDFIAFLG